jgi:hypothetical protein
MPRWSGVSLRTEVGSCDAAAMPTVPRGGGAFAHTPRPLIQAFARTGTTDGRTELKPQGPATSTHHTSSGSPG